MHVIFDKDGLRFLLNVLVKLTFERHHVTGCKIFSLWKYLGNQIYIERVEYIWIQEDRNQMHRLVIQSDDFGKTSRTSLLKLLGGCMDFPFNNM